MYTNKHSPSFCFAFASNRKQHSVDIQISQRQGYTVPKDFSVLEFYTRGKTHIFILFSRSYTVLRIWKKVIFLNVSVCVSSICCYLDLSFLFERSKIERISARSPVLFNFGGGGEDWSLRYFWCWLRQSDWISRCYCERIRAFKKNRSQIYVSFSFGCIFLDLEVPVADVSVDIRGKMCKCKLKWIENANYSYAS